MLASGRTIDDCERHAFKRRNDKIVDATRLWLRRKHHSFFGADGMKVGKWRPMRSVRLTHASAWCIVHARYAQRQPAA